MNCSTQTQDSVPFRTLTYCTERRAIKTSSCDKTRHKIDTYYTRITNCALSAYNLISSEIKRLHTQIEKQRRVMNIHEDSATWLAEGMRAEWSVGQGGRQVGEFYPSYAMAHLLMVSCCLTCCCFGMQMMLGERRVGLPSPELLMLLLRPLRDMLSPACEWFIMFLVFIGKIPLSRSRKWHKHITVHRAGLSFHCLCERTGPIEIEMNVCVMHGLRQP